MNPATNSYLSFSTNGWFIAIGLLILLGALCLGLWNWKRSGFNRGIAWLECLRLLVVALIVFLLQEPEWVQVKRTTQKPKVKILIDRSRSMETADATDTTLPGQQLQSRAAVTERLLDLSTWNVLSERFEVKIESFPGESGVSTGAQGTNLSGALQSVLTDGKDIRSVVVVSDGDWNEGFPPSEAAISFRAENIPIHTIAIGAESKLPDLAISSLDLPTFGVKDKAIRIPFSIASSLTRDYVAQVALEVNGEKIDAKEIRIGPMSQSQDHFVWTPTELGEQAVRVQLPPFPEEGLVENNEAVAAIEIREEKLKVLIIETYPRWEYRFLRNALSRDPGVEVSCLLLHPKLDKPGGGNRDYIASFPDEPEELAEYDVVFLGDVGVGEKQLTEEECLMLRGLVEFQASGLVLMPGPYGFQATLENSALESLIPVVVDPLLAEVDPIGRGDKSAMHFELTESGRRSLLTKLSDQDESNVGTWANLPGFQWYMPVARAKAGAETLAVHQQAMNEFGRLPLIVTKPFGVGKVLYMATDGAWRWRRGVEDLYHYRFWGQVVRWMAYQRHMNQGESIRFYYSPEQPTVGNTMTLKVNVMSDAGEPMSSGNTTLKIESPSGKASVLQLKSAGEESWGLFQGEFAPTEPGKHKVVIAASATSQTLEAEFAVTGSAIEKVGEPARPYVLAEISKISQGQSFDLSQLASLQDMVLKMPEPPLSQRRVPLWANGWVMALVVLLLSLFWIGRKRLGLL